MAAEEHPAAKKPGLLSGTMELFDPKLLRQTREEREDLDRHRRSIHDLFFKMDEGDDEGG